LPVRRAARFGDPLDGNAVADYAKIERLLAPRGGPRPDQDPRAGLPKTLAAAAKARHALEPIPDDALEAFEAYGFAVRHLERGLTRTSCDWRPPFEEGLGVPTPDLRAARHAAELLAISAELDPDGTSAVRKALQIVAYGEDLARHGTLIGAMVGIAVQAIGLGSLEHTMRSRELPAASYDEVISVLGSVEQVDLTHAFEAERVGMGVELARATGRGFGEPAGTLRDLRAFGPVFFEREWAGFEAWLARCQALSALPATERPAAVAAFDRDLASSWLIVARLAIPNLVESSKHLEELRALLQSTRVLAAAHLLRLETGSFPDDASPLARLLGGELPGDPFRSNAALSYRLAGDEVRCWSFGRNLVDDGGEGHWRVDKDLVLITSVPPR
jgi:hypothetical protein